MNGFEELQIGAILIIIRSIDSLITFLTNYGMGMAPEQLHEYLKCEKSCDKNS